MSNVEGNILERIYFIVVICMLCALVGCSNSNESNTEQNEALIGNEKSEEVNLTQTKKPPSLTITFGEKEIKARLGAYSWSYLDNETGQMTGIEAESIPLTELVNVNNAVSVNLSEPITLHFEREPLHYEIRVYGNNDERIAAYNNFKEVKEKGKAIYEISAT